MVCLESTLHMRLIGETHGVRHLSQWHTLRQQSSGSIDAQILQVSARRHAQYCLETPDELRTAHPAYIGQSHDCDASFGLSLHDDHCRSQF